MSIVCGSFLHEQDKQLMIDLACQFQADHLHVVDLPYRLSSWALDDVENIRLWFDGESLVAWAVLQSPFGGSIMLALLTTASLVEHGGHRLPLSRIA